MDLNVFKSSSMAAMIVTMLAIESKKVTNL